LQIQIIGAKTVLLEHGVVVHHLCTVNGHKYSSPSILRYIFHIKPLFSGDLSTNVDFSDFILVKIYRKFDVRKQKLSLNHKKIKAIKPKIMLK
jgi:hypothetical protein